jgi:hypothetical protein
MKYLCLMILFSLIVALIGFLLVITESGKSAKSGEIGHQIRFKLDTESGFYWTPVKTKFTSPNYF